jgi:hypothetical protein
VAAAAAIVERADVPRLVVYVSNTLVVLRARNTRSSCLPVATILKPEAIVLWIIILFRFSN